MKGITDGSIDMILCDLPYGTTACKWDVVIPLDKLWKQYERVIKDNGSIVLTAQQPFSSILLVSNIKKYRHRWVWEKDKCANFLIAKGQPLKYTEDILVFSNRGHYTPGNSKIKAATYNPQFRVGAGATRKKTITEKKGHLLELNHRDNPTPIISYANSHEKRYPKDVIYFKTEHFERKHPTQKPVALMEYLIKTYTDEGDTVLDNCMGSGTTGVACKNLNRNFIGIELDQEYFKIAEKRINEGI
jgi:site-specific DNA-methyltransferase (adenine-specific)